MPALVPVLMPVLMPVLVPVLALVRVPLWWEGWWREDWLPARWCLRLLAPPAAARIPTPPESSGRLTGRELPRPKMSVPVGVTAWIKPGSGKEQRARTLDQPGRQWQTTFGSKSLSGANHFLRLPSRKGGFMAASLCLARHLATSSSAIIRCDHAG